MGNTRRDRARRRIGHLEDLGSRLSGFNVRSLAGNESLFDALVYGTYQQLNWAKERLVGMNMFTSYEASSQMQSREMHVPLSGSSGSSGRMEFEVQRTFGYVKQEITLKVRGADASSTHAVFIGQVNLGDVTINQRGYGRLILSTDPSSGEFPFSAGPPNVQIGDQIRVGNILEGVVGGSADSTDDSILGQEVEIGLAGTTVMRGSATYELEPENFGIKKEFKVKVREATPGDTLSVFVDDVQVGTVSIEADGKAELEFSNDPSFQELPFPARFPEIQVGTTVRVGDLVDGAFTVLPNVGPGGSGSLCDEVEFRGGLRGPTAVVGGSKFEVELEDAGFLEHHFRVHLRNATPGERHPVQVDGVVIGNIEVGDDGRGIVDFSNRMDDRRELSLPVFFPEIHDGSVVEVGTILRGALHGPIPGGGCGVLSIPEDGMAPQMVRSETTALGILASPF